MDFTIFWKRNPQVLVLWNLRISFFQVFLLILILFCRFPLCD